MGGRLGGGGGASVHLLRGVLPRTREDPLTLELAGAAALYAQCVDGLANPNPNPNVPQPQREPEPQPEPEPEP